MAFKLFTISFIGTVAASIYAASVFMGAAEVAESDARDKSIEITVFDSCMKDTRNLLPPPSADPEDPRDPYFGYCLEKQNIAMLEETARNFRGY